MTGLTRDGTFLIENGTITTALKSFRWKESPLFMLDKVEELGQGRAHGHGPDDAEHPGEGFQLYVALGRGLEKRS